MKNINKSIFISFLLVYNFSLQSQVPTSTILQKLHKLKVLGSVLYIAAHPDDENTSIISYFANEKLYRTAYLSATRGDGGQNLIGSEIREQLGLIRTQELLAARRIDGGMQFFTRANDFGYSKNTQETFNIWGKNEILEDFVWVIRSFRPDIIITRFNTKAGVTHGHHTASAELAKEAFVLSGNKNAFKEQLAWVAPWQPEKLFWNTSWWFYRRTGEAFDTTGLTKINVGAYNPILGQSYTEIAAKSRSMHKSQGFGTLGSRGEKWEYLEQWEGVETQNPFDNITTTWTRLEGGQIIKNKVDSLIVNFNPHKPYLLINALLDIKTTIEKNIKNDFWKKIKIEEINNLLLDVSGTYLEAFTEEYEYVKGDSITIQLEAINRSPSTLHLTSVRILPLNIEKLTSQKLLYNQKYLQTFKFKIPENTAITQPYWLNSKGTLGLYEVKNKQDIGKPENEAPFTMEFNVTFSSDNKNDSPHQITIKKPIQFIKRDPVAGEVKRPVVIQPEVMINTEQSTLFFSNQEPKNATFRIIAGKDNCNGKVRLTLPKNWQSDPQEIDITIEKKGEEKLVNFAIYPSKEELVGEIIPMVLSKGISYNRGKKIIQYDHFPIQTLFTKSVLKVVKMDIKTKGSDIGYIMGAGDEIPSCLEQIGYRVAILNKDDIYLENLSQYDAIVVGIRAFNTVDWLQYKNQELFSYAENGGTVIVQYNTSHRLVTEKIAPFPIKLSRDRVSVEDAPVKMLARNHPVLNTPNKIRQSDFEGWVQERGLYFPNEWSDEFVPILSSNDPDETPKKGGLLVAKFGKGYYIYSGYSWFRELPAGVPGAYRIFSNMISIGK